MFAESQFNGDLSTWSVSRVERMDGMFQRSAFNGEVSKWDVSNVSNMTSLFKQCPFSGNISNWNLSSLRYARAVFTYFHDNALGYLGVLQNEYGLPEDFPRAAQFHQLRALAEGLDLDPMGAARFIAREMRAPELVLNLPEPLDFS